MLQSSTQRGLGKKDEKKKRHNLIFIVLKLVLRGKRGAGPNLIHGHTQCSGKLCLQIPVWSGGQEGLLRCKASLRIKQPDKYFKLGYTVVVYTITRRHEEFILPWVRKRKLSREQGLVKTFTTKTYNKSNIFCCYTSLKRDLIHL